jgi:hypothetical protein
MRFFRLKWLQRILPLLLLVLLNAASFAFIEQQRDREDGLVIHAPQSLERLSSTFQRFQIKYGFDVIRVSAISIVKKIISVDYILGTSLDPLSADFLTYPDRGPPRLITIL